MNSTVDRPKVSPATGVRLGFVLGAWLIAAAVITVAILQLRAHHLAEQRLDAIRAQAQSLTLRAERAFHQAWKRADQHIDHWDRAAEAALTENRPAPIIQRQLTAGRIAAQRSLRELESVLYRLEDDGLALWDHATENKLDTDDLDGFLHQLSNWNQQVSYLQDWFEKADFASAAATDHLHNLVRIETESAHAQRAAESQLRAQTEVLARVQADAQAARARAESVERQLETLQVVHLAAATQRLSSNHDNSARRAAPATHWPADHPGYVPPVQVLPAVYLDAPRGVSYALSPFGYRSSPLYHPRRYRVGSYGLPPFSSSYRRHFGGVRVYRPGFGYGRVGYVCPVR